MAFDAAFDDIDEEIEALREELATCRRALVVSRVAVCLGGVTMLLALTFVAALRTPTIVFGAIAAVLGGTVWYGASASSRADILGRLAEADARKARLFDAVAARNGWRDMTTTIH